MESGPELAAPSSELLPLTSFLMRPLQGPKLPCSGPGQLQVAAWKPG